MLGFELLAIFGIGTTELVVFGLVILLLFGSRLPKAMRSLGRSFTSFKEGLNDQSESPKEIEEAA